MKIPISAALIALTSSLALADDPSRFTLSGFGTLGVVRSDKDDFRFRNSTTQYSGAGHSLDASIDSAIGVQGSMRLAEQLDVTAQIITRKTPYDDYSPQVTWAYLRYRATPTLTIRLGRTTTPFFMFSDSLNLNYITPWIRPPVEVYSLNPFSKLNGIDMLYRAPLGTMDLEVQGFYGNSDVSAPATTNNLKDTTGIKVALAGSGINLMAGYTRAHLEMLRSDTFLRAVSAALTASGDGHVVSDLTGSDGQAEFFSAGFQWEKDNWLTIAEYVKRKTNRYIGSSHAWYVTTGYRFGQLTPYATYAQQIEDAPITSASVAPSVTPLLDLFNATRNNAQKTISIGLRWDIARNTALKGQVERISPGPHGHGIFAPTTLAAYLSPADPVHVVAFSVDFVF